MKRHTAVAATTLVALAGSGALLLPAAASPHSTTHTLSFTSTAKKTISYPVAHPWLDHVAQLDVDTTGADKVIGFDTTNVSFNGKTHGGHGAVVVNLKAGLLYVTLKVASGVTGTISGGTGAYAKATGTATVVNLNKSGTRSKITITFSH